MTSNEPQPEAPVMHNDDLEHVRATARELIAVSVEPNPHALTDDLLDALGAGPRSALLRWAAGEVLREANRMSRSSLHASSSRQPGRSWKESVSAGDLLAQRYEVEGVWMELGACSREHVLIIASDYRDRAARNLARADEFEELAQRMHRAGAPTVADLYGRGERAA
jgi:hypothetical protein